MQKEISNVIIEATYALDNALSGDNYKHIYSYFPGVSTNFVQQYIFKIIDWFKSWKVQLLGINTVYRLGGSYGNIGAKEDSVGDNSDYIYLTADNPQFESVTDICNDIAKYIREYLTVSSYLIV